jgi:hypothetical protein
MYYIYNSILYSWNWNHDTMPWILPVAVHSSKTRQGDGWAMCHTTDAPLRYEVENTCSGQREGSAQVLFN